MHLGHRRRRFNITTGAVLDTIIVENNQAYPSTVYDSEDLRSRFYMELLKTTLSYDSLFGLGGGRELAQRAQSVRLVKKFDSHKSRDGPTGRGFANPNMEEFPVEKNSL